MMPDSFSPSVDIISQRALTISQGYDTLDLSLKVPKPKHFAVRARS